MLPISLQGILYGSLLIGWPCQNHWPDKECSQRNKSESEKSEDKNTSYTISMIVQCIAFVTRG